MPIGGKNAVIAGCGIHHVAVQAREWEASLRLYRDVLGMEPIAEFGSPERKIVLLDIGDGSHMELFAPTAESPAEGSESPNDPVTHFALAVEDARHHCFFPVASGVSLSVPTTACNTCGTFTDPSACW